MKYQINDLFIIINEVINDVFDINILQDVQDTGCTGYRIQDTGYVYP